ncbi:DUF2147 domain-containing protein [Rhodocytophaga aerolata]|uniref:DUF2147 domain-containing protein n=1 Tax=Rhodocytophaga aerolata TaxID=455078 RepID=A0ABT8R231_9BACT|nr:DUF2147 domain-containing protein [Rhodocytophaga aerolata]MDO1445969.1 DUF2147 domain-containing protein [Rhodocytophaga aerolata]
MSVIKYLALLLLTFSLANLSAQNNPNAVVGTWYNGSKESRIEIYKCGEKYCGKIVWLKEPMNEEGKPKVDKNNPDASLKNRPIMGMELMRNFEYDSGNVWEDGEIYDPKSGKTYSCKMTLTKADQLEVRGYVGISLIGRTDVWTRAK